ncbi:unnamed protein product [Symbiodinium pilosum]|uniref:Uncharacterized protein n=1 Tax=Symbiodinium pilosum TaxID=2952 RepID=A0A812U335_SYMPI|nr:unnamed protein product [Symbiodinium pilosum]
MADAQHEAPERFQRSADAEVDPEAPTELRRGDSRGSRRHRREGSRRSSRSSLPTDLDISDADRRQKLPESVEVDNHVSSRDSAGNPLLQDLVA